MQLILGVNDVAYADTSSGVTTTGDVAEILESKYHVMEIFFEENKDKIGQYLADAISAQIVDISNGKQPARDPFYSGEQKTEKAFRDFLDSDAISAILPLTQQITAAQMGVNSRKKSGYNKGHESRPAFIDTGLYQQNFRAWVKL